jgi:hypothetical protein
MSVDRWNCTSYCLCKSRKGHFEKASDDGVWVLHTDHEAEVERLRKLTEWQPIETAPQGVVALFCVVPITADDDHFVDTSRHPILAPPRPPRMVLSKLDCGWSSLEKAILWMPLQPLPQEAPK